MRSSGGPDFLVELSMLYFKANYREEITYRHFRTTLTQAAQNWRKLTKVKAIHVVFSIH
jgi:hypothetical protein